MPGNTAICRISFIAVQDLSSTQFIAVLDKKQITVRRAQDEQKFYYL